MCVLLRLRRVELPDAVGADGLGERGGDDLLREGDGRRDVLCVPCHRGQVDAAPEQPPRELPAAVRAKVEEDRRVGRRNEARPAGQHDRLDELVRRPARVALVHRVDGIGARLALAVEDRGDCPLGALGPIVAVHGVVAPDHRRDAIRRELREIGGGGVRGDVATVRERMDPRTLRHRLAPSELEQGEQMLDVGVDAARRDEPEQMDGSSPLPRPREGPS